MRLLVITDTHLHRPGWGDFGFTIFENARKQALSECRGQMDVALHCGDLTDDSSLAGFQEGLNLLKSIPARYHLWVGGNHDLRGPLFRRQTTPQNYPQYFQSLASSFGVTFLDQHPVIIDGTAFVGGYGAHDASLWVPSPLTKEQDRSVIITQAEKYHRKILGCGYLEFFQMCQHQLRDHLSQVTGHPVILATHTVPSPELVLYGVDSETDEDNAWAGWDDNQQVSPLIHTPNLLYHFCGHTHRTRQDGKVLNVGGDDQPLVFLIPPFH